jgi:hypothetical protein
MVDLKCTEGEAPNPRHLFHLFASTYKERFFTNPLARKFAACVLENDIEELKKLPFSKELLDESMLVIINRQNNQKLRDEIFKIAMADYKKSLPLSTYISNGFASFLRGGEVIPAMNDKMYVVAAALNQLDVVTGVSPKYQPQGYFPTYPESYALKYAVMFDHVDMVGFLINDDMQYSERGDWQAEFNRYPMVDSRNPLIMAAQNNSVKIVELILQQFGAQICPQQISNSICIASAAGNAELVAILAACGKPMDSLAAPLELASANDHVAVLDVLLGNKATLFPSQDESALQRHLSYLLMLAVKHGSSGVVDYLCRKISDVSNTLSGCVNDFHQMSIDAGSANTARILMQHGFVPEGDLAKRVNLLLGAEPVEVAAPLDDVSDDDALSSPKRMRCSR